MKHRVIVLGVIRNRNREYLICKKPEGVGIFPGKWAIPGGGIKDKERMDEALRREVWEEVGIKIDRITPLYFTDDIQKKYYINKKADKHYMIYLYFSCRAIAGSVKLGEEFEEFAWVKPTELKDFDLNEATRKTFKKLGFF